jgi:hypothetical protein
VPLSRSERFSRDQVFNPSAWPPQNQMKHSSPCAPVVGACTLGASVSERF